MKNIFRIILLLILIVSFSCEKQNFENLGLYVNCSDCLPAGTVSSNIEVLLDQNADGVRVKLWEGNLDDSILISSNIAYYSTYSFDVKVDKRYTVTATYYISGNKYIAIDSVIPRVKLAKKKCYDPCFYVYDRICDLRLKYTR